jgi:hypothetical protein
MFTGAQADSDEQPAPLYEGAPGQFVALQSSISTVHANNRAHWCFVIVLSSFIGSTVHLSHKRPVIITGGLHVTLYDQGVSEAVLMQRAVSGSRSNLFWLLVTGCPPGRYWNAAFLVELYQQNY